MVTPQQSYVRLLAGRATAAASLSHPPVRFVPRSLCPRPVDASSCDVTEGSRSPGGRALAAAVCGGPSSPSASAVYGGLQWVSSSTVPAGGRGARVAGVAVSAFSDRAALAWGGVRRTVLPLACGRVRPCARRQAASELSAEASLRNR